jgi:hypothetical protein
MPTAPPEQGFGPGANRAAALKQAFASQYKSHFVHSSSTAASDNQQSESGAESVEKRDASQSSGDGGDGVKKKSRWDL